MKFVPLTRGLFALIDDEDWDLVAAHIWTATTPGDRGKFYARAVINDTSVAMHRFLLMPPDDMQVDHISGLTLDNRRANLRICTRSENAQNMGKGRRRGGGMHSQYKGVHPVARRKDGKPNKNPYYAAIMHNGKYRHIGVYPTQEVAARAYDTAAKQFFGPFARLNFPEHDSTSPNGSFFKPLGDSECETICSAPETLGSAA